MRPTEGRSELFVLEADCYAKEANCDRSKGGEHATLIGGERRGTLSNGYELFQ